MLHAIKKYFLVLRAATYGFIRDNCYLKASALTFYALFSIVPILAVALGIAKGFGFDRNLDILLRENFQEYKDLINQLITFAYSLLEHTKGGIIAGVGVLMLLWSVLGLLGNIESSFNEIWKVDRPRSMARKLSDYLALMLIFPVFFAVTSSINLYLSTQLTIASEHNGFISTISPFLFLILKTFSLVLAWIVFSFAYLFIPNTKVNTKAAVIAGITAGTAFQLLQWCYIMFQVKVSSWGIIYGSFAALPLFLIWIQLSWLTLLAGAEVAYFFEKNRAIAYLKGYDHVNFAAKKQLALLITCEIIQVFTQGKPAPTSSELAEKIGIPEKLVHEILTALIADGVISEGFSRKRTELRYQPAVDLPFITVQSIYRALEHYGPAAPKVILSPKTDYLIEKVNEMNTHFEKSESTIHIAKILDGAPS